MVEKGRYGNKGESRIVGRLGGYMGRMAFVGFLPLLHQRNGCQHLPLCLRYRIESCCVVMWSIVSYRIISWRVVRVVLWRAESCREVSYSDVSSCVVSWCEVSSHIVTCRLISYCDVLWRVVSCCDVSLWCVVVSGYLSDDSSSCVFLLLCVTAGLKNGVSIVK